MKLIESAIAQISPSWAVSRAKARKVLDAYEAAQSSPWEPGRSKNRSTGDADRSVFGAQGTLRDRARYLDENYDLASGVLDALVNWTIGPKGISVEPQPRRQNGELAQDLADQIRDYWERWGLRPEATQEHTRGEFERLLGRSLYRDGEVFVNPQNRQSPIIKGFPFLLRGLESDYCPMFSSVSDGEYHLGVKKNTWGRPISYLMYGTHPGSIYNPQLDYQPVSASNILHLKHAKRLEQTRGVSVFATVMNRFADLKDYEESERIAARIAAAMTATIEKGSPDMYDADSASPGEPRPFQIDHGIVFDNLQVGEKVSIIQGNRPNPELTNFRAAMMRAIASGTCASFSTTSKDYNGTYSAQRQELVEQFTAYSGLTMKFIGQYEVLIYRRFVAKLVDSRLINTIGVDLNSLFDAEYRGPVMPWVDPVKEANANLIQVRAGFKTLSQVHRERGMDPAQTLRESEMERRRIAEAGLNYSSIEESENA